jgi:hypothetical protein
MRKQFSIAVSTGLLFIIATTGCETLVEHWPEGDGGGLADPVGRCVQWARDINSARGMVWHTEEELRTMYGRPSNVELREDGRKELTYGRRGPTVFVIDQAGRVEEWMYPPVGGYYHCQSLRQGCPEIRECPHNPE